MSRTQKLANHCTAAGVTRRQFLHAGSLGAGAALAAGPALLANPQPRRDVNCILLFLVGGPSHIDTWDPKPNAPSFIRGPFRPLQTNVTGLHLSENFPLMAQRADRFAVVRSVHHHEAPIHETGQQLMQTGRIDSAGAGYPHYGAVVSSVRGGPTPFVVLPHPIRNTGVSISHGQGAGFLGKRHEPNHMSLNQRSLQKESPRLRDRYGRNDFGQSCLLARHLIEKGVSFVTVNMFDTVFNKITWDCHADRGALRSTLDDYQRTLCPMFDRAYTALLDDLNLRGMLADTLVVAMGEFGRTPRLNPRGGRDHWPGVWSILFAGGGIRGGHVIGASDRIGAEPRDRPVSPAEVAATVYHVLGISPAVRLPGNSRDVLSDAEPIRELFPKP